MSEKASLLSSIPPVKKAGESLTVEPTSGSKLLTPTRDNGKSTVVEEKQLTEAKAVETVSSEGVATEPDSITSFQFVSYASFVLNFMLAGAAAIILFKKASKIAEERFSVSTKALAITCVLVLLHGVCATYLYNSFLNGKVTSAPLFATMFVWVLIGPMVGYITRNLLARSEKPNRKAAYIDGGIYAFIFLLVACGVSTSIKTNAAMLSSILAGFLMIVPIARSMTAFNVAKARHKELNEKSDKILIYGLLIIPAIMPIVSFAFVCGLSETATLFLINFVTFDFVLVSTLAMIASADVLPEGFHKEEKVTKVEESAPVAKAAPEPTSTPAPVQTKPASAPAEKVAAGNPDDPIIQFLNSEEGAVEDPAATAKPTAKPAARKLPPRKPGKPGASGIKPPKKPGSGQRAAPNAPSGMKAPSKPKKRF